MTGLEAVKSNLLSILEMADLAKCQGVDISQQRFNVVMLGNPGTGKSRRLGSTY